MHILKNGIDYRWQTSEFVKTENIVIWQEAGLELGVHMINRQKLSAALEEYKKILIVSGRTKNISGRQ